MIHINEPVQDPAKTLQIANTTHANMPHVLHCFSSRMYNMDEVPRQIRLSLEHHLCQHPSSDYKHSLASFRAIPTEPRDVLRW
jgi:hypothetical protein